MKRNKFNLSHYKLFSADMGRLYPISCFEVLPGDTLQMSSSVFLRFAPMLAPVMHPIKVGVYSFYVPLRLMWEDFEDFITGGPDGLDVSVPPTHQYTADGGNSSGSIADYLGVPVGYTGKFSAFPHRAYYKIFNEYFRDQDLVSEKPTGNAVDGGNHQFDSITNPLQVAWEKDYFTTCRPWPQKGANVTVPVSGATGNSTLNVWGNGRNIDSTFFVNTSQFEDSSNNNIPGQSRSTSLNINSSGFLKAEIANATPGDSSAPITLNFPTNANLGTVTVPSQLSNASVRLDSLREAFALQRFQEHRAAYGSRYTEYLRYLGVKSSDGRLQRPEYLGGGKTTMQISEVLQTAEDGDNPVGTLRGHGIGAVKSKTFRRFFEEHGLVMTLLKVQPVAIYQQGLNKMFSRTVKEDYWQRELEHIGQQEVMTRELYSSADADDVFGYNNRYDEYRGIPSTVAGEMRNLLDYWHMSRVFANKPVLNASFVQGSPTKRVFAEQTQNEIYALAQHKCVVRRILSKQGNPIL